MQKLPYLEEKHRKVVIFRQYAPGEIAKTYQDFKNIYLLYSVICTQIWLFPLVDDHEMTYITKLRKKNHPSSRLNYIQFVEENFKWHAILAMPRY